MPRADKRTFIVEVQGTFSVDIDEVRTERDVRHWLDDYLRAVNFIKVDIQSVTPVPHQKN